MSNEISLSKLSKVLRKTEKETGNILSLHNLSLETASCIDLLELVYEYRYKGKKVKFGSMASTVESLYSPLFEKYKREKNNRCEICGEKQRLCIHHRNGNHYDMLLENLQLLCSSCHRRLHNLLSRNEERLLKLKSQCQIEESDTISGYRLKDFRKEVLKMDKEIFGNWLGGYSQEIISEMELGRINIPLSAQARLARVEKLIDEYSKGDLESRYRQRRLLLEWYDLLIDEDGIIAYHPRRLNGEVKALRGETRLLHSV